MLTRRFRRTRGGNYLLKLPSEERELLRSLPGQLQSVLDTDDPALGRLFPPAYNDDPVHDAEYQLLMHEELLNSRRSALEVMGQTVDAERLELEQLQAWSKALNDLRLVLGTRLDVTEEMGEVDPDDPRAPGLALYGYLTFLQGEVIEALAASL
jgi:hypothetical protein